MRKELVLVFLWMEGSYMSVFTLQEFTNFCACDVMTVVMVSFTCQLAWATGCPDS